VIFGRGSLRRKEAQQRQADLAQYRQEIAALRNQLTELDSKWSAELIAHSLKMRERIADQRRRSSSNQIRPARPAAQSDVNANMAKLEQMFPRVFPVWKQLFENARIEYDERPVASLSVEGNVGAEQFRMYLSAELRGHVLDIGCGPRQLPHYLSGQDVERIAGIDPLPGSEKRNFEFCQGFAEFLPWPDEEFDAVVIGTSLDHVLSLDMVFSEILRVLRPDGVCVIWLGFIAGAPEYNPLAEHIEALDKYHIFHFDRPWFLKIIQRYFVVREEFAIDSQSTFFSLNKKTK
jgi:SAM-dependent methyltransferase